MPDVEFVDRLVVVLRQVGETDHPTIGAGLEREVELDQLRARLGILLAAVGRHWLGDGWLGHIWQRWERSAERSSTRTNEDQAYILERTKGRFQRQVHLGDGLDSASVTAGYDDGVLTLRIPVSERAQPRKIAVGTGHAAIEAESAEV